MKKYIQWIGLAVLLVLALRLSFYTENLTERQQREAMKQYNPEQLVNVLMRDSLESLQDRALTLSALKEGLQQEGAAFVKQHARRLGIGSPLFFVLKVDFSNQLQMNEEAWRVSVDGCQLCFPMKYIFGSTARDASGWFHIDDFKNTMDFNAVSAAMNAYITNEMQSLRLSDEVKRIRVLAALSLPFDVIENPQLLQAEWELIPYRVQLEY